MTFVDSEVPSSAFSETLPAINSSSALIRSLRTGSDTTALCISRYGIQDAIGNVAEYTSDTIGSTDDTILTTNLNSNSGGDPGLDIDFNGVTGPCGDDDLDDVCNTPATEVFSSYSLASQTFDATKFFIPMGLPADNEISAPFAPLTIGTSVGQLNPVKFRSDVFSPNAGIINAGSTIGDVVTGGSYSTGGNAAGHFSMEFIENTLSPTREDIGFRCIVPISSYP